MREACMVLSCRIVSLGLIQAANFHSCSPLAPLGALSQLELEFPGFFIKIFSQTSLPTAVVISDSRLASVSLRLGQDQAQNTLQFQSGLLADGSWGRVRARGREPPTPLGPPASSVLPLPLVCENPEGRQAGLSDSPGTFLVASLWKNPFRNHNFQIARRLSVGS